MPASNPQNQALPTLHRTIHTLIQAGLSVLLCRWPSPLPAQAGAGEHKGTQGFQEGVSLELGKPIERELSGGISHFYKITMTSGQFLQVAAKQQGIDVLLALSTPEGKKIAEANIKHVSEESETVSAISELAGAYLIEVRSAEKTAKPGRYEIKIEALRTATAEDRYLVVGDALIREAKSLGGGALEARRKSIEKYHEALDLYRRASDTGRQAATLVNIGMVYSSLGEMQVALESHREALTISRATGDRMNESDALSNIGSVYWSIGETQKALQNYTEVLAISRAIGDRGGEAVTLNNIGSVYWSIGETQKALEKYG